MVSTLLITQGFTLDPPPTCLLFQTQMSRSVTPFNCQFERFHYRTFLLYIFTFTFPFKFQISVLKAKSRKSRIVT